MTSGETAQDDRLAAGAQRRDVVPPLRRRHLLDDFGALHQEIVNVVIDVVEAAAQFVEGRLAGGHVRCKGKWEAILIVRPITESKENIDTSRCCFIAMRRCAVLWHGPRSRSFWPERQS